MRKSEVRVLPSDPGCTLRESFKLILLDGALRPARPIDPTDNKTIGSKG